MRELIQGLLLGFGGAAVGIAGKGEAKGDTLVKADAGAGTEGALDPLCTVVPPADTWVVEDWGASTLRSDRAD